MKKIIAFLFVLSLCFAFVACGNSENVNVPSGYKIASNETSPYYVLIVPEKWTVDVQSGTTTAYYKNDLNGAVVATVSANSIIPESEDITLDTYFDSYKEEFNELFKDTKPDVTTTVLDGMPARRYIFTAEFNGTEYTFWQEICLYNGRVYTLTFSAPTQYYEKLSTNMIDILNLFKFAK